MKRVYLTNIEYDYLFNKGGDGLVAFFATLRSSKPKEVIKKVGKKGPVTMIKDVTGLSRTTIEKHLPQLLQIGLLEYHPNGNIAVHGRRWSSQQLPHRKKLKLVPILVCNKFPDTKICSAFVRVHSRIRKQERQIGNKAKRIEVMEAFSNNKRLSKGDYRIWKKLYRQGITLEELKSKYRSNSTLSNLSFHKILKDSHLDSDCNETSGKHFKSKLIELGLITQKRRKTLKYPKVKDSEFISEENELSGFGGFFQGAKGIYHESSPIIKIAYNAYSRCEKKAS